MVKPLARLGDLVRIRTGKLDANANDPNGAYPFFTCAIEPLRIASHSYDCECVLVAGNGDLNVKHYSGKFDAYQRTYILESLNPEVLDVRYLYHFMDEYVATLRHLSIGGVIKYIKLENLTEPRIPLPPVAEQRRIAAILDQADTLRAKRREALAQLDSLTQSIFIEMFGDPAAGTPKSAVYPLESLLEESFQNGAYFQKEVYCEEGGVEMVHMSDAFGGTVLRGKLRRVSCDADDVRKYSLGTEDILIARRSLTYEGAAKPCMIPSSTDPLIFESSFIRIKSDKTRITPLYLFHYLNNERVRQKHVRPYVTQSTISGINQSNLAQVPVMQPPLEQQKEFGCRIAGVEALKNVHLMSLTQLDSLFASLQHRAFRGEL